MQNQKTIVLMNALKYIFFFLNIYKVNTEKIKKMTSKDEEKFLKVIKVNLMIWGILTLLFSIFAFYFLGIKTLISISTGGMLGFIFWSLLYNMFSLMVEVVLYFILLTIIVCNIFFLNIVPFAYSFIFIALTFTILNVLYFWKAYEENVLYKYEEGFYCVILNK
jgi:hypothetical protein